MVNNISIMTYSEKAVINPKFLHNNHGFTMVEIISVLVIVAIVSGYMFSRMGRDKSDIYSVESLFKAHIRYAQSKSMQSDAAVWGIRMNRNNDVYWLFNADIGQSSAWGSNRRLPPGGTASPANPNQDRIRTNLMNVNINKILVGNASINALTIVYDQMGVPFWTGSKTMVFLDPLSSTTGLNRLSADISITLKDTLGNQKTIKIVQETGFIE